VSRRHLRLAGHRRFTAAVSAKSDRARIRGVEAANRYGMDRVANSTYVALLPANLDQTWGQPVCTRRDRACAMICV